MSWDSNQSIQFKLGAVALWNLLNRRVLDLRNPTLFVLSSHYERRGALDQVNEFKEMTSRELPTSIQESRARQTLYS